MDAQDNFTLLILDQIEDEAIFCYNEIRIFKDFYNEVERKSVVKTTPIQRFIAGFGNYHRRLPESWDHFNKLAFIDSIFNKYSLLEREIENTFISLPTHQQVEIYNKKIKRVHASLYYLLPELQDIIEIGDPLIDDLRIEGNSPPDDELRIRAIEQYSTYITSFSHLAGNVDTEEEKIKNREYMIAKVISNIKEWYSHCTQSANFIMITRTLEANINLLIGIIEDLVDISDSIWININKRNTGLKNNPETLAEQKDNTKPHPKTFIFNSINSNNSIGIRGPYKKTSQKRKQIADHFNMLLNVYNLPSEEAREKTILEYKTSESTFKRAILEFLKKSISN